MAPWETCQTFLSALTSSSRLPRDTDSRQCSCLPPSGRPPTPPHSHLTDEGAEAEQGWVGKQIQG